VGGGIWGPASEHKLMPDIRMKHYIWDDPNIQMRFQRRKSGGMSKYPKRLLRRNSKR